MSGYKSVGPSINPRCPVHGVRRARPMCKPDSASEIPEGDDLRAVEVVPGDSGVPAGPGDLGGVLPAAVSAGAISVGDVDAERDGGDSLAVHDGEGTPDDGWHESVMKARRTGGIGPTGEQAYPPGRRADS